MKFNRTNLLTLPTEVSTTYLRQTREADASATTVTTIATCTMVASNAVLIILTWVKTFGIYKTLSRIGMRTPLTTLLIHDGTIYFVYGLHHWCIEVGR